MEDRACPNCGRTYRTYTVVPCDKGDDCWECDMLAMVGEPRGTHYDPGAQDDVDEVVAWKCAHGTEWDVICRGCGTKISRWGIGAAGFGELCGCTNEVSAS